MDKHARIQTGLKALRIAALMLLLLAVGTFRTGTARPAHAAGSDKYRNFAELSAETERGVDYLIHSLDRRAAGAEALVVAIHGGRIEPGTSRIAMYVAGGRHSCYIFEGVRTENNWDLHVTSTHFDEPTAVELAESHRMVVSIHGFRDRREGERTIIVGGLHSGTMELMRKALADAGFSALLPGEEGYVDELNGGGKTNICNRGSLTGVQLEFSRSLRNALIADGVLTGRLSAAVNKGIEACLEGPSPSALR